MKQENIYEQLESLQQSLVAAKPRSRRRVELELQLRQLRTKALRMECRKPKRVA